MADDALITLRYAQRLLDGFGLTWTDGIPVEGYSNLLWTLLIAAVGKLGFELLSVARVLGVIFGILNVYLIIDYVRNRFQNTIPILLITLFFYTMSGTVSIWSMAGLEQPLVAFLSLWAVVKYFDFNDFNKKNSLWYSSLALGLLCITRPDGIILSIIIGTYHLISNRDKLRSTIIQILKLAVFPTLLYFGQLIFRIYYYGELVPNTALVKVTPSLFHAMYGLTYNLKFMKAIFTLIVPVGIMTIYLFKRKNKRIALLVSILTIWFFYLVFVGGDIFMAFRHHFYSLVFILLILVDGLNELLKSNYFKEKKTLFLLVIAFCSTFYLYQQFENSYYKNIETFTWTSNQKTLAFALLSTFKEEQPLIAVDVAGSLPYWTKFPSLDMLGLNDYYIARHKPKTMGAGFIGHELGEPEYTLDQKPDIFQLHFGVREPVRYIDSLLVVNKRFQDNYRDINVFAKSDNGYDYEGVLWFNLYSTKVGIKYTNEGVIIPAYFLNNDTTVYSEFKNGELLLPIKSNQQFELTLPFLMHSDTVYSNPVGVQIRYTTDGKNTLITAKNTSNKTIYLKDVIVK
ncbi:MAG: hypothetical protein CVV25_09030 [Ignavibacteriae bacterium HGW-Ignavibacteriae-4]|jgi:hypothetical protein|nr:MAG: hypothetical protein CVV25_09030 [Ignavibacteriae bacterium HGW-Ignavibacteriae-4]